MREVNHPGGAAGAPRRTAGPSSPLRGLLTPWGWLLMALLALTVVEVGLQVPEASAQEGKTVSDIRVEGNRKVETEAILRNVRQRKGEPLSYDQISRDIRSIYALGFFEDIRVETEDEGGQVALIFTVTEKPSVLRIVFKGNDELGDDEIKEVVNLKPFSILNISAVKANETKIEELYAEKGFFLTEVKGLVLPVDGNEDEVEVVFQIEEHAKVQIKEITFIGNVRVSSSEIKNIMETREGGFFSFLTGFGTFKETAFEADLSRITAYYYNKGFIKVNVGKPQVQLSRDKKYLFITIEIEEGEQHFVRDIELTGEFIRDKEVLQALIGLEDGEVFSYGRMREDVTALKDLYQDDGYAYANVNAIPKAHKGTNEVSVIYDIQKGQKVYFGRIEVSGNSKTRDKVVRRELAINEGELFSSTGIKRSRARVQRLGFFESVDITTRRGDRPEVMDVLVTVTERPTGTFQVGAGFSSVENFIATAQVSQNNLFGRGQSLSLQATLSSIRTLFNLHFSEPYLYDSFWQFSFDLYDFEFIFNDFTRSSTGGNLTLGYPLSQLKFFEELDRATPGFDLGEISISGTYKLEQVDVEVGGRTGSSDRRVTSLFQGGLTSSMRGSIFWDTRDNRLFPTSGFLQSASVEVADDLTLSENEFIRYTGRSRWYFPVFWELVLKLNAEIGVINSTDETKPVPIFERFFIGGPNSVRGFNRATLGPSRAVGGNPSDPGSPLSDFNIGGNKQLLFNLELEFPIFPAVGIKGVVFADMGNAFDDDVPFEFTPDIFADPTMNFADSLRTAVGFGFRWFSPIGPLRFEWGLPLRRLPGEDPLVFEFSIGNAF